MMFVAYTVTSVTLESQIVIPIAASTVPTPTPTGSRAAMMDPKTMPRMRIESGPETSSALTKSFLIRSSNIQSMAIPSVANPSKGASMSMVSCSSPMSTLACFRSVSKRMVFSAYAPSSSLAMTSFRSTSSTDHE